MLDFRICVMYFHLSRVNFISPWEMKSIPRSYVIELFEDSVITVSYNYILM